MSHRFRIIVIFLVLFGGVDLHAARVMFVGGAAPADLFQQCIRVASKIPPRTAKDSVLSLLENDGYLSAAAELSHDTILVDVGPRFKLERVDIRVVRADLPIESIENTEFIDDPFTQHTVSDLKQQILRSYQDRGHYFATLSVDSATFVDSSVELSLTLVTGPLVKIGHVRFKGVTRTSRSYLEGVAGLHPGDPVLRQRMDDAVERINAAGFLNVDSLPQLLPDQTYEHADIIFYLTEAKSSTMEFAGGYLPAEAGNDGELVGHIRFQSLNLFNRGRHFDLLLQRKDRASSRFTFFYAHPLFIPDLLEISLKLTQVDFDSSYNQFAAEIKGKYRKGSGNAFTAGVSWNKTEPQRFSQPPSRTISGIVGFEATRLDFVPIPLSGYRRSIEAAYRRRVSWPDSLAGGEVNSETSFEIALDSYFALNDVLGIRANVEGNALITKRKLLDLSEQYKLGGFGSLRGYREEQFAGRRTLLTQLELRYRPQRQFGLYLFADMGIINFHEETDPGEIRSVDLAKFGSGIGLSIVRSSTQLALEVGWGEKDTIGEGKLHASLKTYF